MLRPVPTATDRISYDVNFGISMAQGADPAQAGLTAGISFLAGVAGGVGAAGISAGGAPAISGIFAGVGI